MLPGNPLRSIQDNYACLCSQYKTLLRILSYYLRISLFFDNYCCPRMTRTNIPIHLLDLHAVLP